MRFPELKILDKVPNTNRTSDNKEFLLVELDWSYVDSYKIDNKKKWYTTIGATDNHLKVKNDEYIALQQILNEVDWYDSDFLYPKKYKHIFDKYSKFKITKSYYDECQHLKKMAVEEWDRSRPFDTNVRERLLNASISFVNLFFYMIIDSIYIYNTELRNSQEDEFEQSVLLRSLMLYRFWKYQTGGGLLYDKSSEFVKDYLFSIRHRFENEVKPDLIDNIRFDVLGLPERYPDRENELKILIQQRLRDNKLNGILTQSQ